MKTKAEQLEELKATAVKLQQQIEALEKPKQWEPRGGEYIASTYARRRATELAAEKASAAIRTHNRLLAYVDEFGGDWQADWEDHEQPKYSVYYSYKISAWSPAYNYRSCTSGTVYMSQHCAIGLYAKLNSGEVVL